MVKCGNVYRPVRLFTSFQLGLFPCDIFFFFIYIDLLKKKINDAALSPLPASSSPFSRLTSLWSSFRLAPEGDEDERQEHLAEAEEALVCFDPQFPGLLQELGEKLLQDGNSGPQLSVFCHSAG